MGGVRENPEGEGQRNLNIIIKHKTVINSFRARTLNRYEKPEKV